MSWHSPAKDSCLQTEPGCAPVVPPATESVMFPWERRQMDGQGTPLRTWEYVYWWALALAVALMLFNTSKSWTKKEEVDEEAEERKRESARAALAGKSFVDGDDPFEGLTPKEIQAVVEKMTGASEDDPYEGMTPEEINEYAEKHGLSKG
ncbi:unnamed protein product [Ostreobium quekettii]|uniref:Uncharacterized protein n=1 Tax=Ostreobium quekettii TaxID=121088 RepID=A0A8S1J0T2_9CHLO|nr:unnamed protein product [Ostreobium quekettii]